MKTKRINSLLQWLALAILCAFIGVPALIRHRLAMREEEEIRRRLAEARQRHPVPMIAHRFVQEGDGEWLVRGELVYPSADAEKSASPASLGSIR